MNSQCTGPDFVNFGKLARSGRIVGLAPEAVYQVEVNNDYIKALAIIFELCAGYCLRW